MSESKKWVLPRSGGKMGWPPLVVHVARKKRGDPNTFTLVYIESEDFDGYDGAHVAMPLSQARRLLQILPAAIAAAEGRTQSAALNKEAK